MNGKNLHSGIDNNDINQNLPQETQEAGVLKKATKKVSKAILALCAAGNLVACADTPNPVSATVASPTPAASATPSPSPSPENKLEVSPVQKQLTEKIGYALSELRNNEDSDKPVFNQREKEDVVYTVSTNRFTVVLYNKDANLDTAKTSEVSKQKGDMSEKDQQFARDIIDLATIEGDGGFSTYQGINVAVLPEGSQYLHIRSIPVNVFSTATKKPILTDVSIEARVNPKGGKKTVVTGTIATDDGGSFGGIHGIKVDGKETVIKGKKGEIFTIEKVGHPSDIRDANGEPESTIDFGQGRAITRTAQDEKGNEIQVDIPGEVMSVKAPTLKEFIDVVVETNKK